MTKQTSLDHTKDPDDIIGISTECAKCGGENGFYIVETQDVQINYEWAGSESGCDYNDAKKVSCARCADCHGIVNILKQKDI